MVIGYPRLVWVKVSDPDFKGYTVIHSTVYSDQDFDSLAPYRSNDQVRMYTFWGVEAGEFVEDEY